jgi:6-phosphogluconolactonase
MFKGSLRSLGISVAILFASLLLVGGFLLMPDRAHARAFGEKSPAVGHVYVLNNTAKNAVSVFNRYADGTLIFSTSTATGGQGTGSTLGSQGSLQLSPDGKWLFAVDAGSNQISVLRANQGKLTLVSEASSGGIDPVSLTYAAGHVYVVNDGDTTHAANIAGFRVSSTGALNALSGSEQSLSAANPAAGEIRANPTGTMLVVTEKSTNVIDAYRIFSDGHLGNRVSVPAKGNTPYGFSFSPAHPNLFVVSDAAPNAVTSYVLSNDTIHVVSGPVPDNELAPCWLVVTKNGRFAYTANAGSNSVSAYSLNSHGQLSLLKTASTGAGIKPVEMALNSNSSDLYTLNTGSNSLTGFHVQGNGALSLIKQDALNLPIGSTGIAAD